VHMVAWNDVTSPGMVRGSFTHQFPMAATLTSPPPSSTLAFADLLPTLKEHWDFHRLKAEQIAAVQATLDGRDSLVVLSTGFGKSICFQLPAAARLGEWWCLRTEPHSADLPIPRPRLQHSCPTVSTRRPPLSTRVPLLFG
jgi:hypothetical protein